MESTIVRPRHTRWANRLARYLVLKALARLSVGQLVLTEKNCEGQKRWKFGSDKNNLLCAEVEVLDARFYWRVLRFGSIGAGESYIKGEWQSTDPTAVVELFARNLAFVDRFERLFHWFSKPWHRLKHRLKVNTLAGAKRNILAHYDVGNAMYRQFLDPAMLYSSAVYPTTEATLMEAQQHKLKLICERLHLRPGMQLLEIGTGWGALAMYAARHYGVRVTTTTISDAQYTYAQQKIDEAGLTEQITVLAQDYRLLEGQYDRLVSVEMIEAVGHDYLPGFFAKLNTLLKNDGLMLLQAITIADHRYDSYRVSVDYIQKYIFPGGCLPSVSRLALLLSEQAQMQLLRLWDFGLDYAATLRDWRLNFETNLSQIQQLGYDDEFIRMWLFYFHYCEGGFRARSISVVHLLAEKRP